MKKNILAVCDPEKKYVSSLAAYIHGRSGGEFEVQAFTNIDSLTAYAKTNRITMLLAADSIMCREISQMDIGKIMILSQGEMIQELSEYPAVYKYQPADSLAKEVLECYAQVKTQPSLALFKTNVELVGIYSPVSRSGKTSFALAYGQILANSHAVLYLNLEGYAGFEHLMGKTFLADISDLIYFLGSGKGNLICKMSGMTESIGNLDYIPPAFSPYDLKSVKGEQWMQLLEELCMYSAYDVIVLDLGEEVDHLPEILRKCGKIYMPVNGDGIAEAKTAQYEKLMVAKDYEDILQKTRKIKVPYHKGLGNKEQDAEQLIWGELGDYVRKLIREEEQADGRREKGGYMHGGRTGQNWQAV